MAPSTNPTTTPAMNFMACAPFALVALYGLHSSQTHRWPFVPWTAWEYARCWPPPHTSRRAFHQCAHPCCTSPPLFANHIRVGRAAPIAAMLGGQSHQSTTLTVKTDGVAPVYH